MLPQVRAQDGKSGRLLEAYLDRRCPDWRAKRAEDGVRGGQDTCEEEGTDSVGAMTPEEALRVLGLGAGASEVEIKAAYHRLIRHLHPDRAAPPSWRRRSTGRAMCCSKTSTAANDEGRLPVSCVFR